MCYLCAFPCLPAGWLAGYTHSVVNLTDSLLLGFLYDVHPYVSMAVMKVERSTCQGTCDIYVSPTVLIVRHNQSSQLCNMVLFGGVCVCVAILLALKGADGYGLFVIVVNNHW